MKISSLSTVTTTLVLLVALTTFGANVVRGQSNTTTVSVSNQKRLVRAATASTNLIYVTCTEGLVQKPTNRIRAGQEISIQVSARLGPNRLGSFCVGRYTLIDGMEEKLYHIYDSRQGGRDFGTNRNCGSVGCRVKANDTSFYRWSDESRDWEIVFPRTWLP